MESLQWGRNNLCGLSCPALPGKRYVTTGFCSSKVFGPARGALSEFYKLPQPVFYRLRPSPSPYEVWLIFPNLSFFVYKTKPKICPLVGCPEACETQALHSRCDLPSLPKVISQHIYSVQKALAVFFLSPKFTTFGSTNPLALWKNGRWHKMRPCGRLGDDGGHEGQDADTTSDVNRDTFGSMGVDR